MKNRLLVKIKSDSTKKEIRYKTDRNLQQELTNLGFRGVNIIQMRYFDETQSFGNCNKLIVITD